MAMRPVFFCLLFLPGLLFPGHARAQKFPFYNLGIESGLIQSQVTSLAQDRLGHLWIGTLGGLSRYDGRAFTNYTSRDGLPANTITQLAAGPDGKLWIGTTRGLSVYDGNRFATLRMPNGAAKAISHLAVGNQVWCIAGGRLLRLANGGLEEALPGEKRLATACFAKDNYALVAFGNNQQGLSYSDGTWAPRTMFYPAETARPIFHLFEDGAKKIGALTDRGVCGSKADGFAHKHTDQTAWQSIFSTAIRTSTDQLWAADLKGGILVDTGYGPPIRYNAANGLTDNRVLALLQDREGNIWIGTDGQGLFRFSGAPFLSVDRDAGLASAQIMALAPMDDGRIYLGTYDAGLFLLDHGKARRIPFPGDVVPEVGGMARHGNAVWIGTRNRGLFRATGALVQAVDARQNGLPDGLATFLRTCADGRLYAGFAEGLWAWDGRRWDTVATGLPPMQDALVLPGDSLVLGTLEGNWLLHHGRLSPWRTGTAADSAQPSCFAAAGPWLFIGTTDNGLIAYNRATGKARTLNTTSGLRSDFVYNILAPADSVVWIGTGYGIHRISITQRGPWRVEHFGRERGVSGMESNHLAAAIAPDGSLWFGTTGGAAQYRGDAAVQPGPVSLVLQSVKVFGEDLSDTSLYESRSPVYGAPLGLRLPWRMNNLTLAFGAISLTGGAPVEYRYRMMGVDAAWSDWASIQTVTYSNLPAGRREFVAQCRVGNAPGPELRYGFEIVTPFHQTGLFRALLIGGLILIGVGIQFSAQRRKARRARLVEQLRREEQALVRQRTAEDFHDEVGNRITRINVLAGILQTRLPTEAADAAKLVEQIQDNAGQLYSGTRDILWSLTPANDSLYEIIHRIRDFGHDLFGDTEVLFSFEGNDERWRDVRMPMDASRNLIMIFKEAMNNALKYAGATRATLQATPEADGSVCFSFSDNGQGFAADVPQSGNGLKNMRIRAMRIGGELAVLSDGTGTRIALRFKIPPERLARGRGIRPAL